MGYKNDITLTVKVSLLQFLPKIKGKQMKDSPRGQAKSLYTKDFFLNQIW